MVVKKRKAPLNAFSETNSMGEDTYSEISESEQNKNEQLKEAHPLVLDYTCDDFRITNPKLHMHYTQVAAVHLSKIDAMLKVCADCHNTNMYVVIQALYYARNVLVIRNPAYADANSILNAIATLKS